MGGLQGAASGRVHLGSKQLGLSQASGSFAGSIDGQGGQLDVLGGHETLSGGNTYTGQTGIAQGASLSLSGQGSITDSSHVNDAGLLDIGHCAKGASIRSLDGVASGRVQLGSKDLSLSQAHGHFAGSIEGQGGLKLEAGQETLSGVNGYTGATTIDRGATLALQGKGSIAEPGKLHDDGTLEFDQVHDTWNPSIQGKGGLTVDGGHLTLSHANAYQGETDIRKHSTLTLQGQGSITDSSVRNDGTLDLSGTDKGTSVQSLAGGSTGRVGLGAKTLSLSHADGSFAGVIQGHAGGLRIDAGRETLEGANTYSGNTDIARGATLALSGQGAIAGSALRDDGKLDLSATAKGASVRSLDGATSGRVDLGSKELRLTQAAGHFAGSIDGHGDLTVAGGREVLSGSNGYTGQTTIDHGATLALQGKASIAAPAKVLDDGTLEFDHTHDIWNTPIHGSGGVKVDGGHVTLTGGNSYRGDTEIGRHSTLALRQLGEVSGSSVLADGTFDLSGKRTGAAVRNLQGGEQGMVQLGANELVLTHAAGAFAGRIRGQHGRLEVALGHEALMGDNSYTGRTGIAKGARLDLVGRGNLSQSSTVDVAGTFDIARSTDGVSVRSLDGAASGRVELGARTLTLTQADGDFHGTIHGDRGGLALRAGRETLDGDDLSTGATTIAQGATLRLGEHAGLENSAVRDDGELDIATTQSGVTLDSLSGGGDGRLSMAHHTLILAHAHGTFDGELQGRDGSLRVAAGTETLAGAEGYTGDTTIDPGATLALRGTASLAAPQRLSDDGTLEFEDSDDTWNQPILGSGAVDVDGGQLRLGAANRYTGGTEVLRGSLVLGDGASLRSGLRIRRGAAAVVARGAAVGGDVRNAGSLRVGQRLAGAGHLAVAGSYTQTDSGSLSLALSPSGNTQLQVSGRQLNLAGRLIVQAQPGRYLRRTFLLVDGPSGARRKGRFSAYRVQGLSASAYDYKLSYVGLSQVALTVQATDPFVDIGAGGSRSSANVAAVGRSLDSAVPWAQGVLFDRLNALYQGDSLAPTLDAMDGELYAQTPEIVLQGTQQALGRLFQRMHLGRLPVGRDGDGGFLWADASRSRLLGNGNADGASEQSTSVTVGQQFRAGDWNMGVAADSQILHGTRNHVGDKADARLYGVGVFAGRDLDGLRVGSVLGTTWGTVSYAQAMRSARIVSWQSRVGYDAELSPGNELTPMLGLDLQHLWLSGSSESDPLLGLEVPSQSVNTVSALAALRGVHAWQWNQLPGEFSVSLGVRHWFRAPPSSLTMAFNAIPGAPFTTAGVTTPVNVVEAGAGVHAQLSRNLSAAVSYQGDYGRGLRSNDVQLHLAWRF